jgi:hypothetical protein
MRLHHSAIPKPDPIRIPTPRTPITAYAYCGDCGADAGSSCVDEDLKPCGLCPGRVLASKGNWEAAIPKPRAEPERQYAKVRAVCRCCGTSVRSDAKYCRATTCQTAKSRERRRNPLRKKDPRRRPRPKKEIPLVPCTACGDPCSPGSSRLKNALTHCCGKKGCKAACARRQEATHLMACPGCGASQSHTRHCSDLCAHISGLYLRDVRRRSALTPPANSPA